MTLPLNVFVTDAKREKVVTDKVRIDVDVALEKPIGYFSFVRTVTFNIPKARGPASTRSTSASTAPSPAPDSSLLIRSFGRSGSMRTIVVDTPA